jgi:hypothetical protein
MNCTIDSAATEQGCVGRVDNGINIDGRDVAANDLDLSRGSFHFTARAAR